MIFFGHVSAAGILELDHPELYGDLLKGRLANCRVQIDIDRKKTPRSQQQLRICLPQSIRPSRSTRGIPSPKFTKSASRYSCRPASSQ
jgi:hypothetical protein